MSNRLNVLYCSSDFYAPFTGVSICSLLENNQDFEEIYIYLSSQDISQENLKRLRDLVEIQYARTFIIINSAVLDHQLELMELKKWHNSYSPYYKLFVTQLIPDRLDRLLYIESDTIITGSFQELWRLDMGGAPVGLVRDIINNMVDRSTLQIPVQQQYYMGGLWFYDFNQWKARQCEERIESHLRHIKKDYKMADQDIINVVLGKEIYPLPLKYNVENNPRFYTPQEIYKIFRQGPATYYSPQEITEAAHGNAVMNHCLGGMCKRPWEEGNHHPLKNLYHVYLEKTPWAGMKDVTAQVPYYNKIQWLLFKWMPRILYIPIMRLSLKLFLKG